MHYQSLLAGLLAILSSTALATITTPARTSEPAKCPRCGPFVDIIAYRGPNPTCAEIAGGSLFFTSTHLSLDNGPPESKGTEGPCVDIPTTFLNRIIPNSFLFNASGNLSRAYVAIYSEKGCKPGKKLEQSADLGNLQEKCQFFNAIRSARLYLLPVGQEP